MAEIANAAFLLSVLQACDEGATDGDVHEMCALLALECLSMLHGRNPREFGPLLDGLGAYAQMRSVERLHAALSKQPPTPLGEIFGVARVH
jgi:hypothetical protein